MLDLVFTVLLSIALLIPLFALTAMLVGNRFLTLQRDEIYFLHEAYALVQGWLVLEGSRSRAYDLYTQWLGLGMRAGKPDSLWIAVALDTLMHWVCAVLLAWATFTQFRIRRWLGLLCVLVGMLYFGTIGRLSDLRPDYLSITVLGLGALSLARAFIEDSPCRRLTAAVAAGVLFALAVAFSPRALVVLAVALPLLGAALLFRFDHRAVLRIAGFAVLGAVIALLVLWALTGYALWFMVWDNVTRVSSETDWVAFGDRFLAGRRRIFTFLMIATVVASLWQLARRRGYRCELFAWSALSFAAGQLFLIGFDGRIYLYGYSYGLVAYLLLLASLFGTEPDSLKTSQAPHALLAATALTAFFLHQATVGAAAFKSRYVHQITVMADFTEAAPTERLLERMNGPWLLTRRLRARILLCERYADWYYYSSWIHNPVCLQNGFEHLAPRYGWERSEFSRIDYGDPRRIQRMLRDLGLPADSKGIIFSVDDQGALEEVLPIP